MHLLNIGDNFNENGARLKRIIRTSALQLARYSPETPYFPEILTGRQVLNYYMEVRGVDKKTCEIESLRLMKEVGLDIKKDTLVKNYSKGMRQRLGVAQALIGDPDVIFLDEPSAGLDFFGQQEMQALISKLKAQGKQ